MFSLQQTCARAASFKLASTSSTLKRRALTMLKAVVEPKEENGSIDEEEEKVSSSVADAVQSAEKAFEMADGTPAVETSSPKAMQAMM
jgi:hypothetical protein